MRFPRLLFAQAIINIPVLMVYGLAGGLFTFFYITEQDRILDVYLISMILMIDLSFVTGIIASVLFFMKSKYSYNALLIYTLSTVIPNIVALVLMIAQSELKNGKEIIIAAIFYIYPFWLILMTSRPYHIRWARAQGKMSVTMFNPKFLIPFILIASVPFVSSIGINSIGVGTRIGEAEAGMSFSSSSTENRESDFNIDNAHDGNRKTVWVPRYGKGIDQWIRIDMSGEYLPVAEIRISADESGKYGRPGSVLVETSEGGSFVRELDNTVDEQIIPVKEKRYSWIRLTFKSVYPGRENIVSVSEISLYTKKRGIVNMLPRK